MRRFRVPLLLLLPLLAAPACARGSDPSGAQAPPVSSSASSVASPVESPSATSAPPGAASSAPPPVSHRVTYNWAVPSNQVLIKHDVRVPIAPPPAAPLPQLVEIGAGDHPEDDPAYGRMTFAFRGGFPSYRFGYVREVLSEGGGQRVPLTGNAFLQIQFTPAQAHDESGRPSVTRSPAPRLDLGGLVSYGFAGDFEGYVTYGLGLQVTPSSDQVLRVRTGELVRGSGADRRYVVYVDVEKA